MKICYYRFEYHFTDIILDKGISYTEISDSYIYYYIFCIFLAYNCIFISGISYSGPEQPLRAVEDQKHLGFEINLWLHWCRQHWDRNREEPYQLWPYREPVQ